jgi:transcriptional regulator with XRE-family HTH domain
METFSEQLRKQREERKIRLSDVAVQTRISMKFLEAIESGNFEILPETYIRAFIRDYAKAIGLDPDETIKRFDQHVESVKAASDEKAEEDRAKSSGKQIYLYTTQNIGLDTAGVVILAVLSYLAFSPEKNATVTRIDYGYENTQATNQQRFDSAYEATKMQSASLRLVYDAVDYIWVNLDIDEGRTYDLLMKPGTRAAFWGKKKFNMTIGNAGGLLISLNGHQYPPLGKSGAVIRDLTIMKDGTIKK